MLFIYTPATFRLKPSTSLGWEFYPIMDQCSIALLSRYILCIAFTSTGGTDRCPTAFLSGHMMLLLFVPHQSIWYHLVDHPFFGFRLELVLRGDFSIFIGSILRTHGTTCEIWRRPCFIQADDTIFLTDSREKNPVPQTGKMSHDFEETVLLCYENTPWKNVITAWLILP